MRSIARVFVAWAFVTVAFVASAGVEAVRRPDPARAVDGAANELAAASLERASAAAPANRGSPAPPSCGDAMVLVEGEYCPDARETCLEWQDPPSRPFARCATFAPSVCEGRRVHLRFCIDRDELPDPSSALPRGHLSWTDARRACETAGKRLCRETEWELACEGEQMLPYPTGYRRDAADCNVDKEHLLDDSGKLRDVREAGDRLAACVSPYGVRNMVGNVDEWVWRDRTPGPFRSALKGGWWMPGRDRCRPATTAHGEAFRDLQTGARCCADAVPEHLP